MAKDLNISYLLDFYGDLLTDKQQALVEYYYNNDLSLSEIAENEGITRQGVRDAVKRAEAQMLDMEEKLGLMKRHQETRAAVGEIRRAAEEISNFNMGQGAFREIDVLAKKIYDMAERLAF